MHRNAPPSTVLRRSLPAILTGTLVLAPAVSSAAPPAAPPASASATQVTPQVNPLLAARALYQRGYDHLQNGRWEKAYDLLKEAWALKKHWQIAMGLGWAEMEIGKVRDAVAHLTIASTDPEAQGDPALPRVTALLQEAMARLPRVRIQAVPPGAKLSIDGEPAGEAPMLQTVPVDPGEHTVTAELGPQRASRRVVVPARNPGQNEPFLVSLEWPSSPGPVAPERESVGSTLLRLPVLLLGGGVVATGVAGGIFFAQADAQSRIAEARLAEYVTRPVEQQTDASKKVIGDMLRREDELRTGALVSWIGSGLCLIGGTTAFFLLRREPAKTSPATKEAPAGQPRSPVAKGPTLQWAPLVSPHGGGLWLQGQF